jgi:translation initiation factor 2B subunit (eIF-2B alpha/beta/delta family)
MKPIYSLLILVISFSNLYSQDSGKKSKSIHAPEVKEATQNMFQGAKNAYSIVLMDVDDKMVENLWEDLIKNYKGKVKNVKKADEKIAEAIRIQSISGTGDINVYSKAEEQGDDVLFTVWFEMDNGNFLSSRNYPSSYTEAVTLLENFGITVKRKKVEEELDAEKDKLEDLEKELSKLEKRKEGLEKDIEDYQKRIEDAKKEITDNITGQESFKQKIEEQKAEVEKMNKKLGDIH